MLSMNTFVSDPFCTYTFMTSGPDSRQQQYPAVAGGQQVVEEDNGWQKQDKFNELKSINKG